MNKIKKERKVSYRSSDSLGRVVPFIQIQGQFLQLYGFHIGDNVDVSYSNGLVSISKINRRPGDAAMAVAR